MALQKRKIFDAIDLVTNTDELASVENIDIDMLVPFSNHPFRLYEGERLDDMVKSVKEYGVITPVIVRKNNNKYEILSGHNRTNASKIAGLKKVPCIIKEDLTQEEAMIYVVETNLMQRSFTDLLISEKAAVLKAKYETLKNQGKRNDIIRELMILNGGDVAELGFVDNRSELGKEYGLSSSSVGRFLRINSLTDSFKEMVDKGELSLVAGVELSYVKEQQLVYDVLVLNGFKITPLIATKLKSLSIDKNICEETILSLYKKDDAADKKQKINVSNDIYEKYLKGKKKSEINDLIDKAIAYYCENISE